MSSYLASADDLDSFIDFTGGVDANYAPEESTPFTGPQHDYTTFRQQTGFPSGSMSTIVGYGDVNMDSNDFMSQSDFNIMPDVAASNFDIDFERTPRQNSAFFPQDDFIDPTTVYEPQPQPVRLYPGSHTQHAAEQAKAAALAKQQTQRVMQSSVTPTPPSSSTVAAGKGKQRANSHVPTDSAADRKITDILNSMRHKSVLSTLDEEDDDHASSRKDDDDLDEDERLLASEEGKKLSSKERRQLRNKVSARAFRSRRKEYISQLEGDLANKTNEANDLRLLNRKLLEENNQLKNLTRTVLAHPAFHTFLDDMSRNPTFVPPPAEMIAPLPSNGPVDNASQSEIKMEQDHQGMMLQSQPEDLQVNMLHMPQNTFDMSMLDIGNDGREWNHQPPAVNFQQPSVFAVFELPSGPPPHEISLMVQPCPSSVSSSSTSHKLSSIVKHGSSTAFAITQASREPSVSARLPRLNSADECLALIDHLYTTLPARPCLLRADHLE